MDISVTEFASRYQDKDQFFLIDVREELEFQTFNIGGDNIPLGMLLSNAKDIDYPVESEIVLVCQRGLRSKTATKILQAQGYKNARNLEGGLLALRKHKNL